MGALLLEIGQRYRVPLRRLSRAALQSLMCGAYPGNVRELRHILTSAALSATGECIELVDVPRHASVAPSSGPEPDRAEKIRQALRASAGHRGRAAELLGISRATFYRQLELYQIDPTQFEAGATPA